VGKSEVRIGMKIRAHVVVDGRVQGVFFRATTREEATMKGVNGWVRNLHDGKVEAVFEGEENSVEELIDFCRRGPPAANVIDIRVERTAYRGEYGTFTVR
jgi:acylphosphatase